MSEYSELLKIKKRAESNPHDYSLWVALFEYMRIVSHERTTEMRSINAQVMRGAHKAAYSTGSDKFLDLYRRSLLYASPYDFDSYMLYIEWNREPEKKFYQPRRRIIRPVVQDLQDLEDRIIEFLGISLPTRVGKSTVCIFFLTWIMGKRPSVANVMSGHSDKLTVGFHGEVKSIITDQTQYLWPDVFPFVQVADVSAKNETIDLEKKKRFPTLTCRSIGGTLTGAVEVGEEGCLYCDDLIEDLEESLNPERLQNKYDAYLNQLKDRKKDGAFELMVGTRWNVGDPIGRIKQEHEGDPKYRFRVIPALNDDGESNFVYDHGKGFSTQYYMDMKASIDDATWNAKYQGDPYIREGLLFPKDGLEYYNGILPDGDPDRICATVDVAWGGGDSLSMPVGYLYGDTCYVHDVVFNKADKEITRPVVVGKIKQHMPHQVRFEANNGGDEYCDKVNELLLAENVHVNLTHQRAPTKTGKLARIIQVAPDIKRFAFRSDKDAGPEYRKFLQELNTFVMTGQNAHDDAPDSLAMLVDLIYHGKNMVSVFKRMF